MAHQPDHAEDAVDTVASRVSDGDADEDVDAATIAAAMGFSSFGMQARPSKKRRFNPQADAVVAVSTGSNSVPVRTTDRARVALTASSSASSAQPPSHLPLHPSPQQHKKPHQANTDEIDLDLDEDEDDDTAGGAHLNAGDNTSKEETAGDGSDPEPQYVDTSRPVGEIRYLGEPITAEQLVKLNAEKQARIDSIVAAGNAAYSMTSTGANTGANTGADSTAPPPQQLDGSVLSKAQLRADFRAADRHGFRPNLMPPGISAAPGEDDSGGPGRGGRSSFSFSRSSGGFSGGGGSDGGGGGSFSSIGSGRFGASGGRRHGGDWWTDYYDPTSNENPWAHLELGLSLPSRGSWLERGHHQTNQGRAATPAAAPGVPLAVAAAATATAPL